MLSVISCRKIAPSLFTMMEIILFSLQLFSLPLGHWQREHHLQHTGTVWLCIHNNEGIVFTPHLLFPHEYLLWQNTISSFSIKFTHKTWFSFSFFLCIRLKLKRCELNANPFSCSFVRLPRLHFREAMILWMQLFFTSHWKRRQWFGDYTGMLNCHKYDTEIQMYLQNLEQNSPLH